MIKSEIIADSKNEFGNRITTFLVTFPRIILAELNTHRMLSRNSASSRAIPFEKMLDLVQEDPFIPIKWMKDHKGMQGNEYFGGYDEDMLRGNWLYCIDKAVEQAKYLNENGLTKQIVNRLLEPFMWHTAIITATEWENFFALRAHEATEIHLQDLAYKMLDEYNKSIPKELKINEWHIPFGDTFDKNRLLDIQNSIYGTDDWNEEYINNIKIKIATARCARLSYLNFEGNDDYKADIKLHDSLEKAGHVSPFEHCAKSTFSSKNEFYGNFKGFIQYRKMIKNENREDSRILKK